LWQSTEAIRLERLARVPDSAWPADPEKLLAALQSDRTLVRDVVADGKEGLVALLVDAGKKRGEIVRLNAQGVVRRIGRYADQPGENDDTLGAGARALLVDKEGNIWVTTSAWGQTSAYRTNQDGSPFEESVTGAKGAVKKFSPEGKLLGAVSLLDAPTDLVFAEVNGKPVALVSYRNVSSYHGAQVREGCMLVSVDAVRRVGEIKVPGGTVAVDGDGRLWNADVAGHIACFDLRGKKLFDVKESPTAAVPDAVLPVNSPAPVIVRAGNRDTMSALFTLTRKIASYDKSGAALGAPQETDSVAESLLRFGGRR
jgi:hypothetical protein